MIRAVEATDLGPVEEKLYRESLAVHLVLGIPSDNVPAALVTNGQRGYAASPRAESRLTQDRWPTVLYSPERLLTSTPHQPKHNIANRDGIPTSCN